MKNLIGVDEAGRGAWAGPLVVGAARLRSKKSASSYLLKDSKILTRTQREKLYELIKSDFDIASGWVSAEDIDSLGLAKASEIATLAAISKLTKDHCPIIIDGNVNYLKNTFFGSDTTTLIKGDSKVAEIMAAAIVAKVERDLYMREVAKSFAGYDFENHVGYGTKAHHDALRLLGVSVIHRKSYKPIALLA